jgi:hypothetical protein
MRMTRLRSACDPKPTCPTLFLTDRGTLIVQGWIVTGPAPADLPVSQGEAVVEVPVSLLWVTPTDVPSENPAFRLTGRDTAIVRGRIIDDPEVLAHLSLPDGETAVEVALSLLPEVVTSAQ